jgi:cysteine-rich repeat protein
VCNGAGACVAQCNGGTADGSLQAGEECDDNNMTSGDGCSSGCTVEPFFQCNTTASPSVCVKQEQNCNDGLDNDGDGNTDAADAACSLPAYFPACAAGQALHVYRSKALPMAFVDSGTFTIQLNVPLTGTIQKAAVLINATHAYDADVDLSLSPPGGAFVDICSDNGSSGVNFSNMVLDSTCATAVTAGTAPFAGCYGPETSFASLNNTQARGVWSLRVTDDGMGDTGTLSDWAVALCTTP